MKFKLTSPLPWQKNYIHLMLQSKNSKTSHHMNTIQWLEFEHFLQFSQLGAVECTDCVSA